MKKNIRVSFRNSTGPVNTGSTSAAWSADGTPSTAAPAATPKTGCGCQGEDEKSCKRTKIMCFGGGVLAGAVIAYFIIKR
jgi:hypothetical protein